MNMSPEREPIAPLTGQAGDIPAAGGTVHTLLLVDDTPENLDLMVNILMTSYRTKVAINGERALRIARQHPQPDLILLDIMMPGMNGYEVCTQLKQDPETRDIPVIFVTAMDHPEDERKGLELGAVDYLTKPVSPAIMLARVKTHLALYDQNRELNRLVNQRTQELLRTRQQIIRRLGRAAEFRDNETGNHVIRMSHYSRLIAEACGLGEKTVELLFNAAPMHDVGKIGIPDRILLKPGRLDPDEWEIMKQHAAIGAEIIGQHDDELLNTARTLALNHHERWDGKGYPNGLMGENIPLLARIIAIADVFDALSSERPYKNAWTLDATADYIRNNGGSQFDPGLMEAFEKALPEITRIHHRYADRHGPLSDADL